jgi:hypothetical protein
MLAHDRRSRTEGTAVSPSRPLTDNQTSLLGRVSLTVSTTALT